jgi:O-antigen/teichoic acid export membrane protein
VAWFYESLLQREMEFKRRFVGQMAQSLGFTVTSIGLALAGAGVWSLVLGQVASMVIFSATYLIIAPHRVRPTLDRRVAREVFVSGRGFLAQGWLAWISENVDYLLVGRLLGSAQLGFYSMAYRLSELTHLGIADPVAKVTFPAFARMRRAGESVTTTYISILRLVALSTSVIGALLSGAAAPFTAAVFGPNWLPMIGPLAVLGVWAAVVPAQATVAWLLNSSGHAGSVGALTAVVLVFEIPLLVVAAHSSTTAVSFVILGQSLVTLTLLARLAHSKVGLQLSDHIGAILPILAAAAIAWLAARAVAEATAGASPFISLLASALAGSAVYAGTVAIVDRSAIRLAIGTARRLLRRDVAVSIT